MSLRKYLTKTASAVSVEEEEINVENDGLVVIQQNDAGGENNNSASPQDSPTNDGPKVPPALLDGELFQIVSADYQKDTCVAFRKLCVRPHTIKGSLTSTGNFYTHIKVSK